LEPSLEKMPEGSGTNDLCDDCKTAVADAKKMIEDKDTQVCFLPPKCFSRKLLT